MIGTDPPATPETPRPAAATNLSREQILLATARCLRESGYDATTIRRIAADLDCAVGSIYRYYKDKHELLSAVTQRALEPVAALSESAPVEDSARAYHAAAMSEPETYRLMFWLGGSRGLPSVVGRVIDAWSAKLGSAERALRGWSLLHGAVLMGLSSDEAMNMLAAGGLMELDAAPGPRRATPPPPPRIVITATVPPSPAAIAAAPAKAADDVCLL